MRRELKQALHYRKLEGNTVQCTLCPHFCTMADKARGVCGVRQNIGGTLFALTFGRPCAVNVDPIEKKPLYHFLPGASTLSIATVGCNFSCAFCQNWQISKGTGEFGDAKAFEEYPEMSPQKVVDLCRRNNSRIISYTYTEPTIFFEYMMETAKLAKKEGKDGKEGIRNVIVSNGFINEEPLRELCKYLDAANIDLKAFNDKFYREICSGSLEPVKKTLKILKEEGVWLEVTNLIVDGKNDDMREIEAMCKWIAKELGRDTPLHFSRAHGDYKMEGMKSTPMETLEKAERIAKKHLDFVYLGNVFKDADTFCPKCNKEVVQRSMMSVKENILMKGSCPECNTKISGVWF